MKKNESPFSKSFMNYSTIQRSKIFLIKNSSFDQFDAVTQYFELPVFSKYYGHYLCQDVCCNFLCDRLFSSRYIWKFIFCKQAILVTWVMKIRNLALHRKSIIIIHQNYEIVIHCIFYNIITINYGALNSSELMQVRTWLTNQHWHNFVTR